MAELTARRRAVLVLFFANGASFASWLPRVPEVRDRLDLSLSALGTVLLGMGLGGLLSSVVAGMLVDRLGSRRTSVGASVVLAAGLPLIGLAPTALALAGALVVLGAVDALSDVAMNAQAAQVQREVSRSVMQRFHAAWSIGAVVGAGAGTAAAAVELSLTAQLAVTGAVLVVAVLAHAAALAAVDRPPEEAAEGVRRAPVITLLALLATTVAMVEGTPGDWAAVFGSDVHGASGGVAGLGFVAVSGGMVVGRLGGDRATDFLGGRRLFVVALLTVAAGLAIVVTSPVVAVAIGGFLVVGFGVSVLFPALYLQAATTPGVPSGLGLGVMSMGARVGFLLSPVVVGAISEASSLRVGLGLVIGLAIVSAATVSVALRRTARGRREGAVSPTAAP